MKVLTLNVNQCKGFSGYDDEVLKNYLCEIDADVVVLQEVARRNLEKENMWNTEYKRFSMVQEEHMNGTPGYVFVCMKDNGKNSKIDELEEIEKLEKHRKRCLVGVNNDGVAILGVHVLMTDQNNLIDVIKKNPCDIVLGDFNANGEKSGENWKLVQFLINNENNKYMDLWAEAIKKKCAYHIGFNGQKVLTEVETFKTYIHNTHIDYIFAKSEKVKVIKEVLIDTRTLSFTDHCAVIADIEIKEQR